MKKACALRTAVSLSVLVLAWVCLLSAQQSTQSSAVVPRLMNFSGRTADAQGRVITGTAGITFSIYKDQFEGSPLWLETQNVQADTRGNYTVQLGSATSEGLPLDLFTSGEARWLGVRVNGGEEQPRVLLLSVPYALKAADAQTLGGLPPSAFMMSAAPAGGDPEASMASGNATQPSNPPLGGSGTTNFVPLWTPNGTTLGNSVMFQLGSGTTAQIGINETSPLATLDVKGSGLFRGLLEMATINFANPSKGFNSQPFNLESSAYNSGSKAYTLNHFQWQAEPVSNNTTTPGATLNLLYGTDPAAPAETGLSLSSKGLFTFAAGQTFPGAGTVTSVALSAPSSDFTVSGSPIKTSGTLGLNWTIKPTNADTANAIVKRDGSGAFSAGTITATAPSSSGTAMMANGGSGSGTGLTASGGLFGIYSATSAGDAILATSTSGIGVDASSGSGSGIFGESSTADGIDGYTADFAHFGITGTNGAAGGTGVYGYGAEGGYFLGAPLTDATGPAAVLADGASNSNYYGEAGGAFFGGQGGSGFNGGDGLYAYAGDPQPSNAGYFGGNVTVDGNLTKSSGSFKIDDPLDPANKYLYHSFVESPDMMNIYNGNVTTDASGNAVVELPAWFEALNRDFRYQLTVLGQFAQAIVSKKVANHQFGIRTDKPGVEVSWQLTGIRQDAWANAHRIPVETDKLGRERGFYLHPELFGAGPERSIAWVLHPEAMKQVHSPRPKPITSKHLLAVNAKTTADVAPSSIPARTPSGGQIR